MIAEAKSLAIWTVEDKRSKWEWEKNAENNFNLISRFEKGSDKEKWNEIKRIAKFSFLPFERALYELVFHHFEAKFEFWLHFLLVQTARSLLISFYLACLCVLCRPCHQFRKIESNKITKTVSHRSVCSLGECSLLFVALNEKHKPVVLNTRKKSATFVCIYLFRLSASDIFLMWQRTPFLFVFNSSINPLQRIFLMSLTTLVTAP